MILIITSDDKVWSSLKIFHNFQYSQQPFLFNRSDHRYILKMIECLDLSIWKLLSLDLHIPRTQTILKASIRGTKAHLHIRSIFVTDTSWPQMDWTGLLWWWSSLLTKYTKPQTILYWSIICSILNVLRIFC